MINAKLQNIIDTKSAIGNAIVNKGGTITSETPFFNYAAQIDGISTGTPQTIFAASDGSKWALTNVVNLTNVSNNVTHDFNYWQPANNGTSDPILNVGTVNGNISGNIRIVQVNQVNIAQYGNIVATDTLGGKYVGFNGYDSQTNPTPTGNTTFNRWLLNNSATGTVIFANATFATGTYNGPNSSFDDANMSFINNTASYGGEIVSVTTNNGFIYAGGGFGNQTVQKFHESNLVRVGNTASYGGTINSITINNGFIYVAGQTTNTVRKYHESNLAFVGNTASYGGDIFSITTNNGFIYVGGSTDQTVKKFHESNLAFVGNTASYGGFIFSVTTNNGFIYVGGSSNQRVKKFHESNLVFVSNTADYGGTIYSVTANNGFIYAGGATNRTVQKFHESNLAFVGNTAFYGGIIYSVTTNNGFIYVGGVTDGSFSNGSVKKYYESNLAYVGNTANYGGYIQSITTNNGFIYAGGATNRTVQKFQETGTVLDTQTFYTATKIKE
jgi:hypothetical protein